MVPVDGDIEPEIEVNELGEKCKRKPHPVRLTVGNWIALASLLSVLLISGVGGGIGWLARLLDRYQTKADAKIAALEQALVDQAQQAKVTEIDEESTRTQERLATQGAVLANVRENVRRVMQTLEDGVPRRTKPLPAGVSIDDLLTTPLPAEPEP